MATKPRRSAKTAKTKSMGGPRSLTRLLGLFDTLAKNPDGRTLAELSEVLGSPKSSLLNLFRPLVAEGYLLHAAGAYQLGPSLFRLASNIMSVWNFSGIVHPYLVELSKRSHETVYLGVLDKDHGLITYVDAIDSRHSIRYSITVGTRRPLYCTAAGRILLAFEDQKWVQEYLRNVKLESLTPNTLTDRRLLRKKIDEIRESGISVTHGELFEESGAVAAPVFGANGKIAAALAIGAPSDRLDQELPKLVPVLKDIAGKASGLPLTREALAAM